MGCSTDREKLENEIIKTKMEIAQVQLEIRNNKKFLQDFRGNKVQFKEDDIQAHLCPGFKSKMTDDCSSNVSNFPLHGILKNGNSHKKSIILKKRKSKEEKSHKSHSMKKK